MDPWVWSALLLFVGLCLVVVEVFIPSGGILGFLSIASLLTGVILAFYHHGALAGFIFLGITTGLVPLVLAFAFRYWPQTPMGRRLLLGVPRDADVLPDTPQLRNLRALVGKRGVAKTMMLPSGAIVIDGQTIDALSEGPSIEAGQNVRVIEVRGNRVVVRLSTDAPENPNDVLSRPIESLGIEGTEDPLS